MKKTFLYRIIFLLLSLGLPTVPVSAAEPEVVPEYFEAKKVLVDWDYVLNDSVEFVLFDLSELKLVNDSKDVLLADKKNPKKKKLINALKETQDDLKNLPSYFYTGLGKQILENSVPITLYSEHAPSYTKPIKLFVKIKLIHLEKNHLGDDGISSVQPMIMRIYGQFVDKKSSKVLIKFYDAAECTYTLGKQTAETCLQRVSTMLMKDLSLFLKTKY